MPESLSAEYLRQLVATNQIPKAVEEVKQEFKILEEDQQFEPEILDPWINQLYILESQFNSLESDTISGGLSVDQQQNRRNRLTLQLFKYFGSLTKQPFWSHQVADSLDLDTGAPHKWKGIPMIYNPGVWIYRRRKDELGFEQLIYPEWKTMLGYPYKKERESSGELWKTLLHPFDKVRSKRAFEKLKHRNIRKYLSIFRLRKKDGGYKWITSKAIILNPLKEPEEQIIYGVHNELTFLNPYFQELFAYQVETNPFPEEEPKGLFTPHKAENPLEYTIERLIEEVEDIIQGSPKKSKAPLEKLRQKMEWLKEVVEPLSETFFVNEREDFHLASTVEHLEEVIRKKEILSPPREFRGIDVEGDEELNFRGFREDFIHLLSRMVEIAATFTQKGDISLIISKHLPAHTDQGVVGSPPLVLSISALSSERESLSPEVHELIALYQSGSVIEEKQYEESLFFLFNLLEVLPNGRLYEVPLEEHQSAGAVLSVSIELGNYILQRKV